MGHSHYPVDRCTWCGTRTFPNLCFSFFLLKRLSVISRILVVEYITKGVCRVPKLLRLQPCFYPRAPEVRTAPRVSVLRLRLQLGEVEHYLKDPRKFGEALAILQADEFEKKSIKRAFNTYSDNIYYLVRNMLID